MTRVRLLGVWFAVLLVLGFVVARQQADARRDLEERFSLRVEGAQSFAEAYVRDLARRGERIGTTQLSGRAPTARDLERIAAAEGFPAALLLDGRGRVLQSVPRARALEGVDLTNRYEHLDAAVASGSPAISNVVPSAATGTPVTAIAVPFDTPHGRRVFSGAHPLDASPLAAYLDSVHPARSARVAIVDVHDEVLAVSGKGAPGPGTDGRLRVEREVAGTPWRLVAAIDEDELLAPIGGVRAAVPWLILVVLAALGLLTVELLARRRAASRELATAREQAQAAFEQAAIGMALIDVAGRWARVNGPLAAMLGDSDPMLLIADDHAALAQLLAGAVPAYTQEKRVVAADGSERWCHLSVTLVHGTDGGPAHFIAQVQDVTESRRMRAELEELATCDPLTGLWNRRRFEEELEHLVGLARRYEETSALLMVDVDDFKPVNDTYGHKVGDELLREIARAIAGRLRATDAVARVGGDEFAVLLRHASLEDAATVADEIGEAIRGATVVVDGEAVFTGASVGVALIDAAAEDPGEVMVRADVAMYATKQRRRGAR